CGASTESVEPASSTATARCAVGRGRRATGAPCLRKAASKPRSVRSSLLTTIRRLGSRRSPMRWSSCPRASGLQRPSACRTSSIRAPPADVCANGSSTRTPFCRVWSESRPSASDPERRCNHHLRHHTWTDARRSADMETATAADLTSLITTDGVTLPERLDHWAVERPDAVCLYDGETDTELTYADFGALTDTIAGNLAGLGISKGDRISVFTTNS